MNVKKFIVGKLYRTTSVLWATPASYKKVSIYETNRVLMSKGSILMLICLDQQGDEGADCGGYMTVLCDDSKIYKLEWNGFEHRFRHFEEVVLP